MKFYIATSKEDAGPNELAHDIVNAMMKFIQKKDLFKSLTKDKDMTIGELHNQVKEHLTDTIGEVTRQHIIAICGLYKFYTSMQPGDFAKFADDYALDMIEFYKVMSEDDKEETKGNE